MLVAPHAPGVVTTRPAWPNPESPSRMHLSKGESLVTRAPQLFDPAERPRATRPEGARGRDREGTGGLRGEGPTALS